jgi:hypothetical protein
MNPDIFGDHCSMAVLCSLDNPIAQPIGVSRLEDPYRNPPSDKPHAVRG